MTQSQGIAIVRTSFEEGRKLEDIDHLFLVTASAGGIHYKVSSLDSNETTADLRSKIGQEALDRMRVVGTDVIDERVTSFTGYIPHKVEVFREGERLATRCYADEKSKPNTVYQ